MPAPATNAPPNFIMHEEMRALMGTAHHKPSGRRHLPSMTRHLTFWMPETLENALQQSDNDGRKSSEPTAAEKQRTAWVLHFENLIIDLFVALNEIHPKSKSPAIRAPSLTNFLLQDAPGDGKVVGLLHNYYQYDETTGRYRLQGEDTVVVDVDVAWHPSWVGSKQTRHFIIKDGMLSIISAPVQHPKHAGQLVRGIINWRRESMR